MPKVVIGDIAPTERDSADPYSSRGWSLLWIPTQSLRSFSGQCRRLHFKSTRKFGFTALNSSSLVDTSQQCIEKPLLHRSSLNGLAPA